MTRIDGSILSVAANITKLIIDDFGKRIEKKGITRVQWLALYHLGEKNQMNQKTLSRFMNLKDSTVGRLIDRMERNELVIRKRDKYDKRTTILSLTSKGLHYREEIIPEIEMFNYELNLGISSDEMEIFENVMRKMIINIEE